MEKSILLRTGIKWSQIMSKDSFLLGRRFFSPTRKTIQIFFFIILLTIPLLSQSAWAAQIRLAWDPNSEPDLAGYKIYYGTASGTYTNSITVGNVTTCTLTGLPDGQTYYIAATAYDTSGDESGYSNEVSGIATDATDLVVDIYIGGTKRGSYAIPPSDLVTPQYPGVMDGPVRVVSTNGAPIFVSERSVYGGSFNEVMGYPGDQLTTEYWFPWYDQLNMDTWILVGNP